MSFAMGAGATSGGLQDDKTFYDKMVYDTMQFRKKKDAKHEVGVEIEGIVPEAAEVRLLGNKHR